MTKSKIPATLATSATPDRTAIIARLTHRQQILDQARKALKDEFIGIDENIDTIIGALSSWFLFPEAQEPHHRWAPMPVCRSRGPRR